MWASSPPRRSEQGFHRRNISVIVCENLNVCLNVTHATLPHKK
jgi:hypothetical protein